VTNQFQLYRSRSIPHLRASTTTSPDTKGASPLSTTANTTEKQLPEDNNSDIPPDEAGITALPLPPALAFNESLSEEDQAIASESESRHAGSRDSDPASRSEIAPTEDPPDESLIQSISNATPVSPSNFVSTEAAPDKSASQSKSNSESQSNHGAHETESKDKLPRPQPAPLMVTGYTPFERDESLPPQVHALWIGDPSLVAERLKQYGQMGFEMTIHNSIDDILDGFAPHVRHAYELAIPRVVGFDFLKLLLLYKFGGLVVDADTYPLVFAHQVTYTSDCRVLFGKEAHLDPWQFDKPTYRKVGGITYGLNRPYQLLNWAMLAREPRNKHVAELIDGAMRHFYGLRDMDESLVQDVSGSGLMSDYVALLYAEHGLDYVAAFNDMAPAVTVSAVDGLCILENELRDGWIHHDFMNTWRQPEQVVEEEEQKEGQEEEEQKQEEEQEQEQEQDQDQDQDQEQQQQQQKG
jgi:hypothetical protein